MIWLMKSRQSNFNLRSPASYVACSYLIATVLSHEHQTEILTSYTFSTMYWYHRSEILTAMLCCNWLKVEVKFEISVLRACSSATERKYVEVLGFSFTSGSFYHAKREHGGWKGVCSLLSRGAVSRIHFLLKRDSIYSIGPNSCMVVHLFYDSS